MTLEYTIAAIPTEYKGRRYRSRLEAKWAAFFDLCGWSFEYEPYDLGAWSPDFLINVRGNEVLVEVKPVTEIDVPTIYKMHTAAERSGFKGDLMLVGSSIFGSPVEEIRGQYPYVGWLCSSEAPESPPRGRERSGLSPEMQMMPWFTQALLIDNRRCDVAIGYGYESTRSGSCGGLGVLGELWLDSTRHTEALFTFTERWSRAANSVQWRGR